MGAAAAKSYRDVRCARISGAATSGTMAPPSTSRSCAVIVAVPVAPPASVAVIVATPALTATASPVASTDATAGVSLDQVIPTAVIAVDASESVCVPLPSCPHALTPQQRTPLATTAQL